MTPSPLPAIACRPTPLLGRLPKTPVCPTYAPGAAATAALLSGVVHLPKGSRVVAIVSGDNVDPERALECIAG
jgi:threonine dehydratase